MGELLTLYFPPWRAGPGPLGWRRRRPGRAQRLAAWDPFLGILVPLPPFRGTVPLNAGRHNRRDPSESEDFLGTPEERFGVVEQEGTGRIGEGGDRGAILRSE